MTGHTAPLAPTDEADDSADARKSAAALFWIGPISLMLCIAISSFASTQYDGSGLTMFAVALLPFGGLSMLLWLTVKALRQGK